MQLTFYSKENCSICEKGFQTLESLKNDFSFTVKYVDIYQDDQLLELYMWRIPVVTLNSKVIDEGILSESKLRERLEQRSI